MEKRIEVEYGGHNNVVFGSLVNKLMPTPTVEATGPVIFLEHTYANQPLKGERKYKPGMFSHPHKGVITLRYVLDGTVCHRDSLGNCERANEGDVHWMFSGNGIVHEEFPDIFKKDTIAHSLQFWINLPVDLKKQNAQYRLFAKKELPFIELPGQVGMLKVILGSFGHLASPIPTTGGAFIYHIMLYPRSKYRFLTKKGIEYAAFVPAIPILINDKSIGMSKIANFTLSGDYIDIENICVDTVHMFIYGGLPYVEPYVFEGPFVVETREQISEAYKEFFENKYGKLDQPTK